MDDDEDDPVVQEFDVYLSKQLAANLHLFQYPVRPTHMNYDEVNHLSAKVKPKQQKVELELEINTNSSNYAKSKGEQFALNVDGSSQDRDQFYQSDKMDKQVLTSSSVGVPTSRYIAGLYKDGELHLTPLNGIVQLKPSFNYLDRADTKQKELGGGGDAAESSQDEEEEAKPVTVKFARRETDESKARRMASFEYITNKLGEEPWVNVNHYQLHHHKAERERLNLLAHTTSDRNEFQTQPMDYLKRLIPKMDEETDSKPALPSNVLSLAELKFMTLGDQIKALLTNAKVIRFSQLLSLLSKGADGTSALRSLQQVALLVQGCWVVKSEVLYPKDTFSPHSGVPAETLCRGRDYVMWRFTQSRTVIRRDISTVIKLPADDVKEILEQLAQISVNKGWEFSLDFDSEFVNRHPEVVQRQQMLWDAKFQQLSKVLKLSKADLEKGAKAAEMTGSMSPDKPKRRRTNSRSRTKSGSERTLSFSDYSDTDMDPPKDRVRRNSGRSRNPSGSNPRSRTNSLSDTLENNTKLVTNGPNVKVKIEKDVENDHSNELKKELHQFLLEKLNSRHLLTLPDLKNLFKLKLAECPAGHILGTGVSDVMLQQGVLEVGSVQVTVGEQIMFLYVNKGDSLDAVRSIVAEHYKSNPRLRFSQFKKKVEETLSDVPNDNDLKKILKDFCVTKSGGYWILKGVSDL